MKRALGLAAAVVVTAAGLSAALAGAAPPVVGWRTDGSGLYPNADPPTEWSADKNVVWKTPTPAWSNATPILVGEKIFITSEPYNLVCLSKADGKVLWTRANSVEEAMSEADKKEAADNKVKAEQVRKDEIQPVQKQLAELNREIKTLQPRTTQPDGAEAKARIEAIKPKLAALNKQLAEANAKLFPFLKWEKVGAEGNNGYSSATPVSDGKFVCAVYGNGLAACYDLEGNRKWIRFVDRPTDGYGFCSSPALAGNKLIVHINAMVALDVETGKELWRSPEARWHWGSAILMKVGSLEVIVSANGDVVRLADGKVLVKGLCPLAYNSPILADGVGYWIQAGGKAAKLTPKGEDDVAAQVLWTTNPKSDRYYASPVYHNGLLFDITQANWFSIIDAADGKVVLQQALELGGGRVYPSVALAGKYLFVSNDNGTTLVLQPGREYKEVAKNTLEKFRSSPVFEGKRMYIRAYKAMYCIGQ